MNRLMSSSRCQQRQVVEQLAVTNLRCLSSHVTGAHLVTAVPVQQVFGLKPQLDFPLGPLQRVTGMDHVPESDQRSWLFALQDTSHTGVVLWLWNFKHNGGCVIWGYLLTWVLKSPLTVPAWASAGFVCPTIVREVLTTLCPSQTWTEMKPHVQIERSGRKPREGRKGSCYHGDHGCWGHVLQQDGKERLWSQLTIVLRQEVFRCLHNRHNYC